MKKKLRFLRNKNKIRDPHTWREPFSKTRKEKSQANEASNSVFATASPPSKAEAAERVHQAEGSSGDVTFLSPPLSSSPRIRL